MFVALLAMILCGLCVVLGVLVLAPRMVMRRLMVMMRRGVVMSGGLVMMLFGWMRSLRHWNVLPFKLTI
jgi:hypothetical protein